MEAGLILGGDAEDMAADLCQTKEIGVVFPRFKVHMLRHATPSRAIMCDSRDDTVQVRSVDGEDSLSLRFLLKGKQYHLLRDKQEPVSKALKRIVTNLSKNDKEKKKKKKRSGGASNDPQDFASVEVHIYTNGSEEISPETANQDAWISSNTFVVNGTRFTISLNTPVIKHLRLPGCLMTECATVPLVQFPIFCQKC